MSSTRKVANLLPANDAPTTETVSPLSREIIIGLVGYAGAGCSTVARRLELLFTQSGYKAYRIKLSGLIAARFPDTPVLAAEPGINEGSQRFERAKQLQDLGDKVRGRHGGHAVAALAVRKIKDERGASEPGTSKIVYILDSIKHDDEVKLLRKVYESSFRLIAVHCERGNREDRLIGDAKSAAKYKGVQKPEVISYIDRDEKDTEDNLGQQVRDAFYLADFFLDNNSPSQEGVALNGDIDRFISLILGKGLVRPNNHERAMYHAHAAALQSACLSRQVGATLTSKDGSVIATGTNDVPKFGGGVYDESSEPDHRCFHWEFQGGEGRFVGCHNQRKKKQLQLTITTWLADKLSDDLALAAHPKPMSGFDTAETSRNHARTEIHKKFIEKSSLMSGLPGVKDIIEYSRSIHAEMNALFSAARNGTMTVGTSLYCTTYPCHNCARHLVTAGVAKVYYIEPYVKSLATELHSDSIAAEFKSTGGAHPKMAVVPFTGVGPRMYEDFFAKQGELKDSSGAFVEPKGEAPAYAVRLRELMKVEEAAMALVAGDSDE
ncbi:MAG: hypothetical protein INF65_15175 [Roseomonas sp.]|nr:hypothetical protein [Roseomonas sp.]MCA3774691.1 hypothetical protein [Cutibacterium sp.]